MGRIRADEIVRFLPALAIMVAIFVFSAQPNLSSGLGDWDLLLRKLAHMAEYAALWLSIQWGARWRAPVLATVVVLAYAATDELHQTGVTGRSGTAHDWAIDAAGCGLAVLGWVIWTRRRAGRA